MRRTTEWTRGCDSLEGEAGESQAGGKGPTRVNPRSVLLSEGTNTAPRKKTHRVHRLPEPNDGFERQGISEAFKGKQSYSFFQSYSDLRDLNLLRFLPGMLSSERVFRHWD